MAKNIKITSGVINVSLHPHSPQIYSAFIEAIYKLKQPVPVRGDRYGLISLLNRSEREEGIFTGYVTTFVQIDQDEPWFDAIELKEADNTKVSQVSIPPGLFPSASAFSFIFDTKKHRFFIQTYSKGKTLSINSAARLLQGLSEFRDIVRNFGEAKITVTQSQFGLERALALPTIKRVTITLLKPNADIFDDDFEDQIEEYLEQQNSKRMTVVLDAEAGKSIPATPQLRRIGEAALESGSIRVDGRDARGATTISTKDFPRILHDQYDPDEELENQAFRRLTGH